ncbi:uncharacterized protein P884DRAFT_255560 [Thermothelomyces heterothallicus CBS 202.75]|uniref:uncharacterized protein n=1 Tax=Thermothelomyces heterothallicus CBS 202.75 TaxID=1149848 RepID=UPI003744605D
MRVFHSMLRSDCLLPQSRSYTLSRLSTKLQVWFSSLCSSFVCHAVLVSQARNTIWSRKSRTYSSKVP